MNLSKEQLRRATKRVVEHSDFDREPALKRVTTELQVIEENRESANSSYSSLVSYEVCSFLLFDFLRIIP